MDDFNNNFHFNNDSHNGQRRRTPGEIAAEYTKLIVPEMSAELTKYESYVKYSFAAVVAGFILFALGGFTAVMTEGRTFAVAVIGFILFGAGGVLSGINTGKKQAIAMYVSALNEIKLKEVCYFSELHIGKISGDGVAAAVIQRLIDTGNLQGYEIIGGRAVAKASLALKPSDLSPPASPAQGQASVVYIRDEREIETKCSNCGADFQANEKFCSYCGKQRKM